MKNNKISLINLALNGFNEDAVPALTQFLKNTGEHFTLVLAENKLEENTKTDLRAKFKNRLLV